MELIQGSTLRVLRLPVGFQTEDGFLSGAFQTAVARPHPLLQGHVGLVDVQGTYYIARPGSGAGRAELIAVFQLELLTGAGFSQQLRREWRAFEHLADDGVVLCHHASGRILFAQLPLCEGDHGAVFLFGSHDAEVLSLAANRELLLSGGADGNVRLWSLDNGTMLDSRHQPGGAVHVTAVSFVGPLMAATGTDRGDVCLHDLSTSRLQAVQRFRAGDGPVTALAPRLTPQQAWAAVLAPAPRGLDGGGVLPGPAGLPWRATGTGAERGGTDTLLAVASSTGWLRVFRAALHGEDGWRLVHSSVVDGGALLSYSPDGDYLAVGSGLRIVVLDAATMQTVSEQSFPGGPLVAAGFMPAAAGGSALVSMPLGSRLTGGMRLRLYAVPAAALPEQVELTVPLRGQLDADTSATAQEGEPQEHAGAAGAEDFLAWLQRTGAAPRANASAASAARAPPEPEQQWSVARSPAGRGRGDALGSPAAAASSSHAGPNWGWQAFASTSTSPEPRDATPSPQRQPSYPHTSQPQGPQPQGQSGVANRSPSAEPWASPRLGLSPAAGAATTAPVALSGTAAVGPSLKASSPTVPAARAAVKALGSAGSTGLAGPGPAGSPARLGWQAYRPSTQPAPRSWITGLPPRADFLPQPMGASSPPKLPPGPSNAGRADAGGSQLGPQGDAPGAQPAPTTTASSGAPPGVAFRWGSAAGSRVADTEVTAGPGRDGGVDADDPGDDGDVADEPELPHSGTLLPASGIPAAVLGSAGRYSASAAADDNGSDDDEGAVVAAGLGDGGYSRGGEDWGGAQLQLQLPGEEDGDGNGEAGTEAAGAEWPSARECSFALQAAGWGGRADAVAVAVAMPASWREGDLELGAAGSRSSAAVPAGGGSTNVSFPPADSKAGSFRFRPAIWPHGAAPEDIFASTANLGPGASSRSSSSGCGSPQHDHAGWQRPAPLAEAAANEEVEGGGADGDGDFDDLERTAYFGDALSSLLCQADAGGARARRASGGPSPRRASEGVDGQEAQDERVPSLAQGEQVGKEREDEDEEDEEDLVPRGAASLPAPQRPLPGQSPRQPQPRATSDGNLSGREEGGQGGRQLPSPSRSDAPQDLQGEGAVGAGVSGAGGSMWGGWANEDLLSGAYPVAAEQDGGAGVRRGVRTGFKPSASARPRPVPRAPPGLSSHRMELSPSAAASNYPTSGQSQGLGPGPGKASARLGRAQEPAGRWSQRECAKSEQEELLPETGPMEADGTACGKAGAQATADASRQRIAESAPAAAATADGTRQRSRQQLQHLRQLRQHRHQHQLRRSTQPPSSAPAVAALEITEGNRDDGDSEAKDHRAPQQTQRHQPTAPPPSSRPRVSSGALHGIRSAGVRGYGMTYEQKEAPDSYDVPHIGSTALLLKKMQALEQVLTKPLAAVTPGTAVKGPSARAAGKAGGSGTVAGGSPAAVMKEYVSEAQREEAARRAATAAANVPPGVQLYHDLPAIDYEEQQPSSRVPKQLHPGWVASRQLKPELRSLWRRSEYASEVCNTRGVALYTPPSTAEVATSVLQLQWIC